MFDLNFISDPGMQDETSDASWSFLSNQSEPDLSRKVDSKQSKTFFIQKNSWKNYVFVLIIIGFIGVISLVNTQYSQVKPDWVLNEVIDLIVESIYLKDIQLTEANFSLDQVKVTMRYEDFLTIQPLIHGYIMESEISYAMYKKGEYNYLNLIFPWKGNEGDGDIQTLQSMAEKTVFSDKISIDHTEDIFEVQGRFSDIISFLLEMAENKQIQKFNLSVSHDDFEQFNLIVQN